MLFNGQKIGLERRQMKKNEENLVNWVKQLFHFSKKLQFCKVNKGEIN